ncbi:MAG: TIGR00180 family glycosyltransferase [Pseudomonadota bacterium]
MSDAPLLIPTRNRPTALSSVLHYLARFASDTRVIVADGSGLEAAEENAQTAAELGARLALDYQHFPADLPLFDRLLSVLTPLTDDLVIMGSDDDYPLMETLRDAQKTLERSPDAVTAMGGKLGLKLSAPNQAELSLRPSRSLTQKSAEARLRSYARWPFSTTYAVTRRTQLIARYTRARDLFLPDFFDVAVGLHDAACGQVLALPQLGYVTTRNYGHAYLRTPGGLAFIENAPGILKLVTDTAADLVEYSGMDGDAAQDLAEQLFRSAVGQNAGAMAHEMRGFATSRDALDASALAQGAEFDALLKEGTQERSAFLPYLSMIVDGVQRSAASKDNANEARFSPTLDAQSSAPAPAEAQGAGQQSAAPPVFRTRPLDLNTLLPLDADGPTLHIIAVGQSNIANHGVGRARSDFGAAMLGGERAPIADPIPGASGAEGSIWPRFADNMAARSDIADLILTNIAQGGTSADDWAPGGPHHERLTEALAAAAGRTNVLNVVVWHQGERDTLLGTSRATYAAALRDIRDTVRAMLPGAHIVICRASLRAAQTSRAVITAQTNVALAHEDCVLGPNTDVLGASYRRDGTHFNTEGLDAFADLLCDTIAGLIPRQRKV